jgi:DnaJ-class molecular chaperone
MCNTERKIVCPKCEGEGYFTVQSGSYFDVSYGNYLPAEHNELCSKCEGNGYVYTDDDPIEGEILWDDKWTVSLPRGLEFDESEYEYQDRFGG